MLRKNNTDVDSLKKITKNSSKTRLIIKPLQRFGCKKHDVLLEEGNDIALSADDDKIIQSIDSIKTYAYVTSENIICKDEIKCRNVTKQYKND